MADTWVVGFGRFQPPTLGHELMIGEIADILATTENARGTVFVSKSEGTMKNPLPALYRMILLNQLYFRSTGIAFRYMSDGGILESLNAFSHRLPRNLIVVAGDDRSEEYERKLNTYNGVEFPRFESITVRSIPRKTATFQLSGSNLRDFACMGNHEAFTAFLPKGVEDVDNRYMYNKICEIRDKSFRRNDHQTTNQKA